MAHTADTYREAAIEHVQLALKLHDELQEYAAAHYWSGLAVECMLRAYRPRVELQFDSRHRIADLVREARLYDFVPEKLTAEVTSAIQEVALRWRNDDRYRPARMLEKRLRDDGVDRRLKGDRLKFSSRRILNAAFTVVSVREKRWA